MQTAICSFSFHRLFAAGKQDMFQYIQTCKELGCTQLDPWNAFLSEIKSGDEVLHAGHNPSESQHLTAAGEGYINKVKAAADAAGLPFGCIAVDGAHIYEPTLEARMENRRRAYLWLDICHRLGVKQMRVDAGGPVEMPSDVFTIIVDGYTDIVRRASDLGVQILIENHWGPSVLPDNVIKLVEAIPGLGLLYDTHNWREDVRDEGRKRCAQYAAATHVKTFDWDEKGNPISDRPDEAIKCLLDANYKGCWGVESCPPNGNEIEGATNTLNLIHRMVDMA